MSVAPNLCCDETKNQGTYTRVTILYWKGTTYYFPPQENSGIVDTNVTPYSFWSHISFPLEPLCKVLQGTKDLQNFIDKCNATLIEHSVVTTIAGVDV